MKKYIFEFIVIFVGITVSLFVDELRKARDERNRERAYVQDFLTDVKIFQSKLDSIGSTLRLEKRHMKYILYKTYPIDSLPISSAFPYYFKITRQLNSNTFKTLVATGDLRLISNRNIIKLIDDIEELHVLLVNAIDRGSFTYEHGLEPIIYQYQIMTDFRSMYYDQKKPDLIRYERLINDKEYIEVISNMYLLNDLSLYFLQTEKARVDSLSSLIKQEIEK
jgi:hypothetical protein